MNTGIWRRFLLVVWVVVVERGWGVAGGRVVIVVIAIRVMTVVGS